MCIIYAVINDYLKEIPVNQVHEFEQGLFRYLDTHEHKLIKAIRDTKQLYPPTEEDLKKALVAYTAEFLKNR